MNYKLNNKLIYFLFFFSGAASLIDEIIWIRSLLLIFGSTTNSVVAVVSAFLGGLAIGSLILGKITNNISPKALIKIYSLLELGVGILVLLSLPALNYLKHIYSLFSDGSIITPQLLVIKFILSSLIIFIPAILMGGTLPVLVKFVYKTKDSLSQKVSKLYATNTLGATFGVLVSAFILIEVLGIYPTIFFSALINFFIALAALTITSNSNNINPKQKNYSNYFQVFNKQNHLIFFTLFLSGIISIAYQILWTRVLAQSLGNFVYAFAAILALYLLSFSIGSYFYKNLSILINDPKLILGISQLGIGLFALLPVVLSQIFFIPKIVELIIRVVPSSLFMGAVFPAGIAFFKNIRSTSKIVGISYFINTLGNMFGGYLASFVLIPFIGSSSSIVLLAGINVLN